MTAPDARRCGSKSDLIDLTPKIFPIHFLIVAWLLTDQEDVSDCVGREDECHRTL